MKLGKYIVKSDKFGNVHVCEIVTTKTGTQNEVRLTGFHKNFNDCLKAFAKLKVMSNDAESVIEFLNIANQTMEEIEKLIDDRT